MGFVRRVGPGFSPLDEELALLPGSLSPYLQEQLTRLSTWIPSFEKAATLLQVFTGAQVSSSGARRHCEKAGAMLVSQQEAEVARIRREAVDEEPGPERLVISVDGAMVPLVGGEWKECKTLVVGEPRVMCGSQGEQVVKSEKLSYFSRTAEVGDFTWQALMETQRRGVATAGRVASVSDGAEWIQGFVTFHRPDAVRILDLPHVGEYVNKIAQALYGEGTPQAQSWWQAQMQQLKEQGPGPLLAMLPGLCEERPHCSALGDSLAYLRKREGQMHYPAFQAEGWPLGSGIVESANKLLVEDRLKGSGMHWAARHVNPLLALRTVVFNDRWDEIWPQIALGLRQQALQRRFANQAKHHSPPEPDQQPEVQVDAEPQACTSATEPKSQTKPKPDADTKRSEPHRPGPNHPWRHSPVGKARYEPWKPYEPPRT